MAFQTADQIMIALGFGSPDPDEDDFEKRREIFVKHVNHRLTAQRTGGADWAADYVWIVPDAKAERRGLKAKKDATIYLIWPDGRYDDPLVFIRQIDDWAEEVVEPTELRNATVEDMLHLVGRR